MPTLNQRIPLLLAIIAALAMLAATGWQGYQFWQTTNSTQKLSEPPSQTDDYNPGKQAPDIRLSELLLFGSHSEVSETSEAINTEKLPETNLRLTLRGALAASGDFPGSALIEDQGGDTQVYLVGDTLPGNAQLRTVLTNRIIIERNGALENLFFPEADSKKGLSVVEANSQNEEQRTGTTTMPSPSPPQTSSDDQARREEIRERLKQLRQRLQDNR